MLLFTWFIYIFVEAKIQHYLIEKRKWKPIYIQLFIIRGMASFIHIATLNVYNHILLIPIFIFQTTSFWILFDLLLNYLRDRPINYKGKDSGWLDKLPYTVWVAGKLFAVIAAVMSARYYIINF